MTTTEASPFEMTRALAYQYLTQVQDLLAGRHEATVAQQIAVRNALRFVSAAKADLQKAATP
jgi:hypothetical protein